MVNPKKPTSTELAAIADAALRMVELKHRLDGSLPYSIPHRDVELALQSIELLEMQLKQIVCRHSESATEVGIIMSGAVSRTGVHALN